MSDNLLDRAALFASTDPCQIPRRDILGLLNRAGLKASHAHKVIAATPDGPVLIRRAGSLEVLQQARARPFKVKGTL